MLLLSWFLGLAYATPCVPLADRPFGARVTVWDAVEGPITELDQAWDDARRSAHQSVGEADWFDAPPAQVVARLASLAADQGRFLVRCAPDSGEAKVWFERALGLAQRVPGDEWRSLVVRARADALCGLGRWDECSAALDEVIAGLDDDSLACERLGWRLDAQVAMGDVRAALDAWQVEPVEVRRACPYASYRVAHAHQALGDTSAAIELLTKQIEELRVEDGGAPPLVEASLRDVEVLLHAASPERSVAELTRLGALVGSRLAASRRSDCFGFLLDDDWTEVVGELLRLGLLRTAWTTVVERAVVPTAGLERAWTRAWAGLAMPPVGAPVLDAPTSEAAQVRCRVERLRASGARELDSADLATIVEACAR